MDQENLNNISNHKQSMTEWMGWDGMGGWERLEVSYRNMSKSSRGWIYHDQDLRHSSPLWATPPRGKGVKGAPFDTPKWMLWQRQAKPSEGVSEDTMNHKLSWAQESVKRCQKIDLFAAEP